MWDLSKRSLVRRLVLLAGIWNLVVLLLAGVFLTAQFRDAARSGGSTSRWPC
jgi:hypothetical protein